MLLPRRLFLAAPLALAACQHRADEPARAEGRFVMEEFFLGRLRAEGRFVSRLGDPPRGLAIDMEGRNDGRFLRVREDYAFSDGRRETLNWRFQRVGPDRFRGDREDLVTYADVRQDGDRVTRAYEATVAHDGARHRVRIDDVLTRRADGSATLEAVARVQGVEVGEALLVIRRIA